MAEAVEVNGPHSVSWAISADATPPGATALLGYTVDGAALGHEKFWENVITDHYGAGSSRDAVFTGEQVFIEFTLVQILRSQVELLCFNGDAAGILPTIGRKASTLDGTNPAQLQFRKEGVGTGDFVFERFVPLEIVQELSHRQTKVIVRGESLLGASDVFYNATPGVAPTATSVVEVNGATHFQFATTDIGYSEAGARITYRYEWDFVSTDDKGGNTHRDAVFQGMRVEVETNGDIVFFDRALVDDMQWHGSSGVTGVLGEIGVLATGTEQVLSLTGPAIGFFTWAFDNARLIARADTRVSSKQTRFSGRWECYPKKATPNLKRFYARSTIA